MAQLHRMDACLDTFSMELYQVNVRVDRIAQWQAAMGGFAFEPTPLPPYLIASNSDVEDMMMMMMVMTMTLQMMMEMLALSMKCLLDILPFVTRDKKGK